MCILDSVLIAPNYCPGPASWSMTVSRLCNQWTEVQSLTAHRLPLRNSSKRVCALNLPILRNLTLQKTTFTVSFPVGLKVGGIERLPKTSWYTTWAAQYGQNKFKVTYLTTAYGGTSLLSSVQEWDICLHTNWIGTKQKLIKKNVSLLWYLP